MTLKYSFLKHKLIILATVIGAITPCAFVSIKSMLSKLCSETNRGKIFSTLSSIQGLVALASTTLIKEMFLQSEASVFAFTSAMFFVLGLIFVLVLFMRRRDVDLGQEYEVIEGDVHS